MIVYVDVLFWGGLIPILFLVLLFLHNYVYSVSSFTVVSIRANVMFVHDTEMVDK